MYQLQGIPDANLAEVLGDLRFDRSVLVSKFRAEDGTWTLLIRAGNGAVEGEDEPETEENTDEEFLSGMLIPGRPSILLDPAEEIAIGRDGLSIEYRGDDSCPYGKSATANRERFEAIVLHHTSNDHSTDWYVQYQIDGDANREPPGHYGYHFYLAPKGKIIQGAPLTKRTNHVSPSASVRYAFGRHAQNTCAIGICCVGAWNNNDFNPTKSQVKNAEELVFALADLYAIPFAGVYGHGEIQSNRSKQEGSSIARTIRAWTETPTG